MKTNVTDPDLPITDYGDDAGRPGPAYPTWQDSTVYPNPAELTLSQWGWEFLRRCPDYTLSWSLGWGLPGDFGLREFIDPAISPIEPERLRAALISPLLEPRILLGSGAQLLPLSPNEAAIIIDLTRSPKDQLSRALAALPRRRRDRPSRPDQYPRYLRVLDGRRAKASYADIARVLRCEPDDIKKDVKAAQKLAWDDYWILFRR